MSELTAEQEQEAVDVILDAYIEDYMEAEWHRRQGLEDLLPPYEDFDREPPDLILVEQ